MTMRDHGPVTIKAICARGVEVGDRSATWFEPWRNISAIVAARVPEDEPGQVTVGVAFRNGRMLLKIDDEGQWADFCAAARDHFPQLVPISELREALSKPAMVFLHWEAEGARK